METFNEFLGHWYNIYVYYYSMLIVYTLLFFILVFTLAYIASNYPSVSSLKKRYLQKYTTIIITKKFIFWYFSILTIIIFLTYLLSIIPSFLRWFFNFPAVHVLYYVLLNIFICFILYILFAQKTYQKYASTKYYLHEDWILLNHLNRFIIIPFQGIRQVIIDKPHHLIRIRYYAKFFFIKAKPGVTCHLADDFAFKQLIHLFEKNNLSITNKNLDTVWNKVWHNPIYLKSKFEEQEFKVMPNKIQNLLEII